MNRILSAEPFKTQSNINYLFYVWVSINHVTEFRCRFKSI